MPRVFKDADGRLRNGWRALAFVVLSVAAMAPLFVLREQLPRAVRPVVPEPLVAFLGVLFASWVCLRREQRPLSALGLGLRPAQVRHLLPGWVAGAALVGSVALVAWLAGGFHLVRATDARPGVLLQAAWTMLGVALFEEALFHGYAFQRAIRGLGTTWAQVVMAVVFCLAHPIVMSDLEASQRVFAWVSTLLAGLLLGLCYLRTGSLWLPVGVHAGWNWTLGTLGFGVSGNASKGWWTAVLHEGRGWLTGGSYGLEASVVSIGVLGAAVVAVARWRGRVPPAVDTPPPGPPRADSPSP